MRYLWLTDLQVLEYLAEVKETERDPERGDGGLNTKVGDHSSGKWAWTL